MDRYAVDHLQVLLKWCVHKGDSILAEFVIIVHLARFVFKPFDLISSDAIAANLFETVPATGPKEPNVSNNSVIVVVSFNR
jgi:hypothetical protein